MMQRIMLILSLNLTFAVNASDCFDSVGRDYHIDPDLIRAIAFRESTMNSHAMNVVSTEKYAIGKCRSTRTISSTFHSLVSRRKSFIKTTV